LTKVRNTISDQKYLFLPFACETLGPWCEEAIEIVNSLGSLIKQIRGEPRSTLFIIQKISLTIHRSNAACITGCMPETEKLNEIYFFVIIKINTLTALYFVYNFWMNKKKMYQWVSLYINNCVTILYLHLIYLALAAKLSSFHYTKAKSLNYQWNSKTTLLSIFRNVEICCTESAKRFFYFSSFYYWP